jgi:hypothetical protein
MQAPLAIRYRPASGQRHFHFARCHWQLIRRRRQFAVCTQAASRHPSRHPRVRQFSTASHGDRERVVNPHWLVNRPCAPVGGSLGFLRWKGPVTRVAGWTAVLPAYVPIPKRTKPSRAAREWPLKSPGASSGAKHQVIASFAYCVNNNVFRVNSNVDNQRLLRFIVFGYSMSAR